MTSLPNGHNLADDSSCGLTAQGDQPDTEPLLRPLDNYGGPTKTFALRTVKPCGRRWIRRPALPPTSAGVPAP